MSRRCRWGQAPRHSAAWTELRASGLAADTLRAVALNGTTMLAAWFLLPRTWLFSTTRPAMLPLFLAVWMYSDARTTNVLGAASSRMVALCRQRDADQVLAALQMQALLLWLAVTVPSVVTAAITGVVDQHPQLTAATIVGIVVLPVGPLVLAWCVGLAAPYRRRTLRSRWIARRQWQAQVRWLGLATVPYALVPFLLTLTLTPSITLARQLEIPLNGSQSAADLVSLLTLACLCSLAMAVLGALLARRLVLTRGPAIASRLSTPAFRA